MVAALGSVVRTWQPNLSRRAVLDNAPLVVLCLVPILLYLPVIVSPFERDEGVYATIAQRLLRGDVPYRDLFDNKPPIVYGWYAFSFLLFGESVVAPRIVAALLLSLTTLAIFGEARLLFSRRAAYFGAGAFALATGLPFVALHANTEAYMLLPLVTSLGAFIIGMRRDRLVWFMLAGALGALAVMTKQVAVWNLVALAIMAVAWRWRSGETAWRRITPLLSLLTGGAAIMALIATPFFRRRRARRFRLRQRLLQLALRPRPFPRRRPAPPRAGRDARLSAGGAACSGNCSWHLHGPSPLKEARSLSSGRLGGGLCGGRGLRRPLLPTLFLATRTGDGPSDRDCYWRSLAQREDPSRVEPGARRQRLAHHHLP
jgi:hypothetical protein